MDLGGMAYYEFNDSYIKGVEFEKADENNPVFKEIQKKIEKLDKMGVKTSTTTIIIKTEISSELKEMMISYGFTFPLKKDNPIIKSN